jgi:hypothetical protein
LNCISCKRLNHYTSEQGADGYGEYVVCWHCNKWNKIKVYFNGDLKRNCDRYCEMSCFDDCEWLINGSERQLSNIGF